MLTQSQERLKPSGSRLRSAEDILMMLLGGAQSRICPQNLIPKKIFHNQRKVNKTKMQKKTETPTETSPVRKATGAMRCYHLPDEARHQIMRILNLCTTKNIAQLFQAKTPISILSLISSTTTPAPSSPHLVTLTSNTYALCFSAEMIKSFLVTIINARIHEPVLHRCRLIPTLTNHILV